MRSSLVLALLLACLPAPATAAEVAVARLRLVDAFPAGPSVADRLEIIRQQIQHALVYPDLARHHGQEGDVRVRFQIAADGSAQHVETTRSSGRWLLDRAAERAVRDAAPLPYVWGRLEVPVQFQLDGMP